MEKALEIEGVDFHQSDGSQLFENLHFSLSKGEKVGIIGANGTGKTTMFLLAAGVYDKNSGQIRVFGEDVKQGKFNPKIGMVFQNQDDQLFSANVWDDIAFGPINMGFPPEEVEKIVHSILTNLNISHLKDKAPHHLSGGEKRLVAIAGVLAMNPSLIIWDEPTSNLDMRYRRILIQIIQNASQDSMLIASHDFEFLLEVCNRIVLFDKGRIAADGPPIDVMGNRPLLEKYGLEVPYSLKDKITE